MTLPGQHFSFAAPASAEPELPPECWEEEQPGTLGSPPGPGKGDNCIFATEVCFNLASGCCRWRSRSLSCSDEPPLLLYHLRPHVLGQGSQEAGINPLRDVEVSKNCREVGLSAGSTASCCFCCRWCRRWCRRCFSWHCRYCR